MRPTPTPPPLAGRRVERQWFDDVLDKVAAGNPRVIVVAGEAGVGKSRLIADVVGRRSGEWLDGVGHCLEEGQHDLPYSPLAGILSAVARHELGAELLAQVQAASPGLLPLEGAGAPVPLDTTSGLTQLRFLDSLVKLFGQLAAAQPTLLVIEDVHWADPATRAFVSYFARNVVSDPVALVLTVRTDELHRRHPLRPTLAELGRLPTVARLDLEPLGTDDLGELLAEITGTPLPRAAVRRIAERSGGNPFYAEQLLALGAGRSDAQPAGGLADLLLQRVDRVSASARRVLEVASIGGQRVEHRLLEAVSDLAEDQLEDALRELTDARLLEPNPVGTDYGFQHALLAEVIAADLLPSDRRTLHARFAAALDADASPARLARHLLGAGDKSAALEASLAAASSAGAVGALDDALAHWRRVLELWDHGTAETHAAAGGRGNVALRAAHAAQGTGDVNEARELTRLAIDAAGGPAERAEARLLLCTLLSPDVTGDPEASVAEATAALSDANDDPALIARATAALARAHYLAGNFTEAIEPAERAAGAAAQLALDAVALGARATALLARRQHGASEGGDDTAENELVEQALAATDVETGLWVLTRLAEWSFRRDLAEGGRLAGDAYAYAAAHGARSSVQGVWARETLTLCRLLSGEWDAVEELARMDPLPVNDLTAGAVSLEAQVLIHRGDLAGARRRLDLAEQVAPDALSRAFVGIAWVSLHVAEQDPVAAVEASVDRLARLPRTPSHLAIEASLVARAMAALGDAHELGLRPPRASKLLAAADRVVARAGEVAESRTSSPISLLVAHRSRLDRSDPSLWQAAVARRSERPFDQAVCRFHFARALLERGDLASATNELQLAATTFRRLGARVMLDRSEEIAWRARIRLDADGQPASDDRAAAERWALTEREMQVLELVAAGRTNRQIGEALFISGSTVGVHVSNILTKLAASTRGEAAAIARQAGLVP